MTEKLSAILLFSALAIHPQPKKICFGFSNASCDAVFKISNDPHKNCDMFDEAERLFPSGFAIVVMASSPIVVSCDPFSLNHLLATPSSPKLPIPKGLQ